MTSDPLVEAQQRTEAAIEQLVQAQARSEARLDHMETRLDHVQTRLDRIELAIEQLVQAQRSTDERIAAHVLRFEEHERRNAMDFQIIKDTQLAQTLATRAGMFREFLADPQVLSAADADAWLGALLSHGQLALADYQELLWADALVRGRRNGQEGYLVVEASWTVGPRDVDRARRRVTLLEERAGVPAWPVVAGYRVSQEAARLLASEDVLHLALPDWDGLPPRWCA